MYKLLLPLVLLISKAGQAQQSQAPYQSMVVPKDIIVCHSVNQSMYTDIPPPEAYRAALRARAKARVQRVNTFEVNYYDFSQEARSAFQKAVDIWSALITTNVPVKIEATWKPLSRGVLGSCGPTTVHKNFPGAQQEEVFYPASLANKIANSDLNGETAEISLSLSSEINWHYNPDTPPPSGKMDLVSVVLHEIGHGLGIFGAYQVNSAGNGSIHSFFAGRPCPYDLFLETASGTRLLSYTPPSRDLGVVLRSRALYFNSPIVRKNFNGRSKVYAPEEYSAGSSISHNDEAEFPAGNANSLMTPQIGWAERIHDPGPITMGELIDMGWANPILTHTKVADKNSRAKDIEVVCKLVSGDSRYPPLPYTLTLNYIKNKEALVSVNMIAANTPDEYRAPIPKPVITEEGPVNYAYYIAVKDADSRTFTWPGKKVSPGTMEAEQVFYKFKVEPDLRPPRVYHTPLTRVRNTAAGMEITAAFKHDYDIQNGFLEWLINDNTQTRVPFKFVSDSTYKAVVPLTGLNLTGMDCIKYRITATDNSSAHRTTVKPSAGSFYSVAVVACKPPQEMYVNNFDKLNGDDFWGDFTVSRAKNFENGAIQSPHPYEAAEKKGTSINYTYELLTPIKVKEGMGNVGFDEVVLVEPGNSGAAFGTPYFFDYVVVEASPDGGNTWKSLATGWNSGDKSDWRDAWNSQKNGSAPIEGSPALCHRRSLNLLNRFKADEEVVLRFRLFSNGGVSGWGWSIDNLAIQVPVNILHNHLDYVMNTTNPLRLEVQVLDVNIIQALSFDLKINEQEEETHIVTPDKSRHFYQLEAPLPKGGLKKGDYLNYRINVTNSGNYMSSLPATGYYRIEVLDLSETPINFSDISTDHFFGNFIAATHTTVETAHPYSAGFGLGYQSDFSATLNKPVKLEAGIPRFTFTEKLLPGTNDYVQIEGSKDGISWGPLSDKYTTAAGLRTVDFFKSEEFKAGDLILLRFRLSSDKAGTGWGWEISNLQFVRNAITAVEEEKEEEFSLFPDPVKKGDITVQVNAPHDFSAEVTDIYGRQILLRPFAGGTKVIKLAVDGMSPGLYVLSLREKGKRRSIRFVKL